MHCIGKFKSFSNDCKAQISFLAAEDSDMQNGPKKKF